MKYREILDKRTKIFNTIEDISKCSLNTTVSKSTELNNYKKELKRKYNFYNAILKINNKKENV